MAPTNDVKVIFFYFFNKKESKWEGIHKNMNYGKSNLNIFYNVDGSSCKGFPV